MSYLGSWKIDDYVTFCVNTHDPDTGVATDADGVPTYRIYEDETATPILTGSMALLDAANTAGFYSERIQLTAANGFEKGKCYTIYTTATVDSDTGTMHHNLQIEAEVDANTVSGTVTPADDSITAAKIAADAITSSELAASALNEIADAVWDEDIVAAHNTGDTAGALLDDVGTPADFKATGFSSHSAADAADAVWNETNTGHVDAGKAGQQLWTDLDAVLVDTGTDGVKLANDTITSAKYDESTAFPIKSTDTGATQIARVGADSDTLETLSDQIDGITAAAIADAVWDEALSAHDTEDSVGNVLNDLTEESSGTYRLTSTALQSTLGAGAITFTYTLTSSVDSAPVADADVWVTSDQAGSNLLASGTTNANGEVVFYLDAGDVYVWRQKSGWNFTNPDTETVA